MQINVQRNKNMGYYNLSWVLGNDSDISSNPEKWTFDTFVCDFVIMCLYMVYRKLHPIWEKNVEKGMQVLFKSLIIKVDLE